MPNITQLSQLDLTQTYSYPEEHVIQQFVLSDNQHYQLKQMYTDDDIAIPYLFPELAIDVTDVFATWQE
jgi:hypothetical protein